MIDDGSVHSIATPALIEQLYPEVATLIVFVVVILCLIALLYISMNWD
ncbi:hypothetical protein [Halovivax cerinus]|uniref:Uncharacterized protein n=1 Tax=Halovivax cerinus TaxID=1487865 RepID=A0ABD5NTG6_9EURY|nr:hypothetical protein [Halovivax cerinus]